MMDHDVQGVYFSKKRYVGHPLPTFDATKHLLPAPVYEDNPLWIEAYWKAWELAFKNFYEPAEGSGFVSQFLDHSFNANIFFWDTAIQTMFLNVAHPLVPGISALDNFYAKQYSTGEICREINRNTGVDLEYWVNREHAQLFSRWGFEDYWNPARTEIVYKGREAPVPNPNLTLDALNNPIAAWAETESYRWTGDQERLSIVREPLIHYYAALQKYIRQGNGLYMTDWASQDNSPRNPFLRSGGTAIDTSSQMVLFAKNLADISRILGFEQDAEKFMRDASELAALVNEKMWNEARNFYFDLTIDETLAPIKTICAFWTFVSGAATSERAEALVGHLKSPETFGRLHPVPSLAADEKEYFPQGGYSSGAVWPPTNLMVIKGLERFGYDDLARGIALKHLDAVAQVYRQTGTFWENYAADFIKEGINVHGEPVVKDMVGWGGVAPILLFIEYAIGLRPNAPDNQLSWKISTHARSGCERFRFNSHVIDLIAEPSAPDTMKITVQSDGEFMLKITYGEREGDHLVQKGQNIFFV